MIYKKNDMIQKISSNLLWALSFCFSAVQAIFSIRFLVTDRVLFSKCLEQVYDNTPFIIDH